MRTEGGDCKQEVLASCPVSPCALPPPSWGEGDTHPGSHHSPQQHPSQPELLPSGGQKWTRAPQVRMGSKQTIRVQVTFPTPPPILRKLEVGEASHKPPSYVTWAGGGDSIPDRGMDGQEAGRGWQVPLWPGCREQGGGLGRPGRRCRMPPDSRGEPWRPAVGKAHTAWRLQGAPAAEKGVAESVFGRGLAS